MQTTIDPRYKNDPAIAADIEEAEAILRSCVHCGFCTATCPTYQQLGTELDSPRGRIYLIKELLEGQEVSDKTRLHLDRCLTCRSCETTCPSGVRYSRLIDIGRNILETRAPRPLSERIKRKALLNVLSHQHRFGVVLKAGRMLSPLLPAHLQRKLPNRQHNSIRPVSKHQRQMLILEGCVQPHTTPNTNSATARVLDRLGISLISATRAGCCGALHLHMSEPRAAKQLMRNNIDAWWPHVENGVEAIVMTASGCGLMVKEYGEQLKDDPVYAKKAARISAITKDLSEILCDEDLKPLAGIGKNIKVAYQASCTLQHGQKISGVIENILKRCGYKLTSVANGHLCCGAAGSYSLLQPKLSQQLLKNKLEALQKEKPDVIVSANVGCQIHLASATNIPVKHWIELLE